MPTKKVWNEEVDRYAANILEPYIVDELGDETGNVPENWKELSNGNVPETPKKTIIIGGHVATSATRWKKAEMKPAEISQSEERMNKFQRENKRRKENR